MKVLNLMINFCHLTNCSYFSKSQEYSFILYVKGRTGTLNEEINHGRQSTQVKVTSCSKMRNFY